MRYAHNYITQALAEIRQAIACVEDRIDVNRIEHEALNGELGELARASEALSALVDEPTLKAMAEDEPAPAAPEAHVVHVPTKRRSATEFRRSVLDLLSTGHRQPFEIRRHTESNDKATARRNINTMAQLGLVEATGETHSRRYAITAAGREWLAASNVMAGESKHVEPEPGTPEPESRIEPFDEPESDDDVIDDDLDDEPFEPEPSEGIPDADFHLPPAPPDPPPMRAKQYKPGHRVMKDAATTETASGTSFWVGRDRKELGEEALRRSEQMSASREGRKVKGLPHMTEPTRQA